MARAREGDRAHGALSAVALGFVVGLAGACATTPPIASAAPDAGGANLFEDGAFGGGGVVGGGGDATAAADGASRLHYEDILFLVDTSEQVVADDPTGQRIVAVQQVLANHADDPSARFALMTFGSTVTAFPPSGFVQGLMGSLPSNASLAQVLAAVTGQGADYEGALTLAARFMDQAALPMTAVERGDTRWIVILIGGSTPYPLCNAQAEKCGSTTCAASMACWAGGCSAEGPECTTPRASWSTLSPPVPASLFPTLTPGMDYNTTTRITTAVQSLAALQTTDELGAVELDTVLMVATGSTGPSAATRAASASLLEEMATVGEGMAIDFAATPILPF